MNTKQSIFLVVSPVMESSFEAKLKEFLKSPDGRRETTVNPLLVHDMLFLTHLHDLHGYTLYFEQQLNRIVSMSFGEL
jgi:hypothetical protein